MAVKTLIYYDCLNYPLTAFEVWRYMLAENFKINRSQNSCSLKEIIVALESLRNSGLIGEKNGFYFLSGREDLTALRLNHSKISVEKIKRLRGTVKILRYLPFVRMIGLTGRLAMKNSQRKSDWDVLIIFRQGCIWTGRTLMTVFLHFLGRRRHGKKIKDRVCLNYFITDNSLEIERKNFFSAGEYSFLVPLFGEEAYVDFLKNNSWIAKFKPNITFPDEVSDFRLIRDSVFSRLMRKILEYFFAWEWLEKVLGFLGRKKINANPLTEIPGSYVRADDNALVFLPRPQAPIVIRKFSEKLKFLEENNKRK